MSSARWSMCAGVVTLALVAPLACARAQTAQATAPDTSASQTTPAQTTPAQTTPPQTAAPGAATDDGPQAGAIAVPAPPAAPVLPQVEPVIPDAEFNAAVPALGAGDDTELNRPLESIEAFERRLSAQQTGAPPQPAPAPAPGAAAPTTVPGAASAVEQVGDAPVGESELDKPLPPLAEFKVDPAQLAQPQETDKPAPVRYVVKVNGLDAADKLADIDLADQFKDASALQAGKGKAANLAMVTARLTDDSALLQRILAAEGWYEASVKTRVDQGEAADKTPQLVAVLDVAPGKRYVLARIVIEAQTTVPPGLIADNIALKPGEPISAARVQGAEAQVAVALPQNGYPFVKLGQRDILLDQTAGDGVYTLPIDTGPRARFGDIATRGDLAFDARHVGVLARFKRGELYDSRKVDDLRQALVATALFGTVSVEPQQTGVAADADSQYAEIVVNQDAGPPRTIAGTVGYGSGEGFKIDASWTHRNLFPPEGALIANLVAGTMEQGAGVIFRRSNAGKRDRTFEGGLQASHSDYDAYSAYTGRLYARLSRDSTPLWQKRITWAVGGELLGTVEKVYDFDLGRRDSRTYYIAGVSGQIELDMTKSLLDPTSGFRVTTLIEPEGSLQGSFTPYARARLDASAYFPAGDGFVMAGRLRLGTILGATLDDLAPSRRFYAGGGGSVRGYAYQKLGPLDPDGDPIGGRSVVEGSAEARYRFGNYGVVAFVDAGQSYTTTYPGFSDIRYGVGVGGRFYTNFGPFRLDVATPLGRRAGESRLNIYVSIGQAF